jgi:aquaporin Z
MAGPLAHGRERPVRHERAPPGHGFLVAAARTGRGGLIVTGVASREAGQAPPRAAPRPEQAWRLWLAEFAGTGLLVSVGLSIVILDTSPSGPVAPLMGQGGRLALTGFLFGTVGALIAVSPVGKVSGAHINPIVTLAFVLRRRLRPWLAAGYVAAQLAGAIAGAATLLGWGRMGAQARLGATVPGHSYGPVVAMGGEAITSAALIVLLFVFVGSRRLRAWTPLLFPPLYAVMVYLEAPVSGTSTNPARSLGPAVVAGVWHGWWVYWAGPALGAAAGVALLRPLRHLETDVAKVYHFEQDRHGLLRWTGEADDHLFGWPRHPACQRPHHGESRWTPRLGETRCGARPARKDR